MKTPLRAVALLGCVALFACDDDAASTPAVDATVDAGCTDDCPTLCPPADQVPSGMVCLPAGTFWMGTADNERPRADDEDRHAVTLTRPFFVSVHEVTQAEWDAVIGQNPSWFQDGGDGDCPFEPCENRPVERVNWYEALAYLNARSEAEGLTPCYVLEGCTGTLGEGCDGDEECLGGYRCTTADWTPTCDGYRLLTEAEWEYAARAGTEGQTHAPVDDIAWYIGTARQRTRPVGDLPANDWGLHDVLGNVAEWTWDIYAQDYGFFGRAEIPVEDPVGEMFGDTRVVRGGGWTSGVDFCRSAARANGFTAARSYAIGLRAARSVPD